MYIFFCNFSSALGVNLNILKDKNCKRGDKYRQRGNKTVKDAKKKFQSLSPRVKTNILKTNTAGVYNTRRTGTNILNAIINSSDEEDVVKSIQHSS